MVPNPDTKQYWNNWKNDMSLFPTTNQERPYEQLLHNCDQSGETLRAARTQLPWTMVTIIIAKILAGEKSFALEMSPCWQIFLQNKHNFA